MRSLQVKFSALVIALLLLASISLAWIATRHERGALVSEVEKRARAVAQNLAGAAKESLLEVEQGDFAGELTLDRLVEEVGEGNGVVAARLLGLEGRIAASIAPEERGSDGVRRTQQTEGDLVPVEVVRRGSRMVAAAPILFSGVLIGEAQVEVDLRVLVDPIVQGNTRQLTAVAVAVVCLGVVAGTVFVALLVGPLRRLRVGVERLSTGDLDVRVPPTSRDEVGELTRAFNEMGDSLQQKERIQSAFGRYVNDYVLNQILEGPDDEPQAGMEREVTILFGDIRRFTRLSEGMKAQSVVGLLNEIFQLVSIPILERGGTIDKFIGDSVMAYFGAPVSQPDHAMRAVAAAVEIMRAMGERNARISAAEPGGSRRRSASSSASASIAAWSWWATSAPSRRTDFTAVGDAVNVAHRLEKLARPGEILVSEAVQRRVRAAARLALRGRAPALRSRRAGPRLFDRDRSRSRRRRHGSARRMRGSSHASPSPCCARRARRPSTSASDCYREGDRLGALETWRSIPESDSSYDRARARIGVDRRGVRATRRSLQEARRILRGEAAPGGVDPQLPPGPQAPAR